MNSNFTSEDFNTWGSFTLFNESDIFMDEIDKETPNLFNALGIVSESYSEDLISNNNDSKGKSNDEAFSVDANLEESPYKTKVSGLDFFPSSFDLLQDNSLSNVAKHEESENLEKSIGNLNAKPEMPNKKNKLKKITPQKTEKKNPSATEKELAPFSKTISACSVSQFKKPKTRTTSNRKKIRRKKINKKVTRTQTYRLTRTRTEKKNLKVKDQKKKLKQKKSKRNSDLSVSFDFDLDFSQQISSIEDLDLVLDEAKKYLRRHSTIPESVMKEEEKVLLRKMNKRELENLSSEQRLQRKRAQDRVCARNAKKKKKKYTDFLERQTKIIKNENCKVQKKLDLLLNEKQRLKKEITKLQNLCGKQKLKSLLDSQKI
ncbi:cyclic amp response element-binding protein a [Anaeramoeba flamelloides]|uniref:Cyclic amp response element-binding protein a n=1 Tax=Anaeramoeba flamelloides TaxID=1746091 RepID=A0ABQ8XK06_9EUKA|nr:cyclic amp response element-binding protein a [Anaeramoeba flamelloides]